MKIFKGNLSDVKGITTLGKAIGIKKNKLDFGIIYSDKVCNTAAVYTQNNVKGAPLYITKDHLNDGKSQAIIINSGIANVCTGKKGLNDAKEITKLAAKELNINYKDVLVASTGLIGAFLPMDKIKDGIKNIKNELSKDGEIAKAILTTDLVQKEITIKQDNFTISGNAKGSGMVHPNMATMLCFICTDADIQSNILNLMLKKSLNKSFNMMTIDMDTSTSDMCVLMANGYAGKVDEKSFQNALDKLCIELAKMVAADGEGATKLIEIEVKNASTKKDAKNIAKSIVSSNLFKCAVYGNDPNWGRILCAMGNSGINFNENNVDVYFGDNIIVKDGITSKFNYQKIKNIMSKKKLIVTVDLKSGDKIAKAWGCDMTEDYIKINAHYHT